MNLKEFRRLARGLRAPVMFGVALTLFGCGSGNGVFDFFGTPFRELAPGVGGGGGVTPPPGTGSGGGGLGGGGRTDVDPCQEPEGRKFIRLSLRNASQDDIVHYFLVLVANVRGTRYPDGAVCADDVSLYTQNGYQEVAEGNSRSFGSYCFEGPTLIYFHENGEFRTASSQFASAIGPARGTGATFDAFFNSSGRQIPVPNFVLFHNPGFGAGLELKVSVGPSDACADVAVGTPDCAQDAWYYVDDNDLPQGSTALGAGSSRRVPNEIQGTGCECGLSGDAFSVLAPSGTSATNAFCDEFLRAGTINYVFTRDDQVPAIPQLVWRVTDATGGVVHDFDPAANVP